MIVASWNVNSLRARLELLQEWIVTLNPDIVLLQETKVQDTLFPETFFEEHGYNTAYWGQKSYNGVAIASKFSIEDVIKKPFLPEEARYIEAFTGGVRVASVYVPNGQAIGSPAYERKLLFMHNLATHLAPLIDADEPVIIGGDFNVAFGEEDVYDPTAWRDHVLFSPPERHALWSLVYQGWSDAVITLPSHPNPWTWWDHRGRAWEYDRGLRIDYLLLSPRAVDRQMTIDTGKSWRGRPRASDHVPVWVTLAPLE